MSRTAILSLLCVLTMLLATACGQNTSNDGEISEISEIENTADAASEVSIQPVTDEDTASSDDEAFTADSDESSADADMESSAPENTYIANQSAGEGSGSNVASAPEVQAAPAGNLEISFTFNRASTHASSQYAVWIEDEAGNLVKTIFATNFTANGGYATRPESLPQWVAIANPAGSANIDAVSGATPRTDAQTYTWSGEDDAGNPVAPGMYVFKVEATMYWASTVVYSGQFELGASAGSDISISSALTEEPEQNSDLITNLTARYVVA